MYKGRKETNFGLYLLLVVFSIGLPAIYGIAWILNIFKLQEEQARFDSYGSEAYYYLIQCACFLAYFSFILCCLGMSRDSLKSFLWDNRPDLYRFSKWYFVFALITVGGALTVFFTNLADDRTLGMLCAAGFVLLLYTIVMYLSAESLKPDDAGADGGEQIETAKEVAPAKAEEEV